MSYKKDYFIAGEKFQVEITKLHHNNLVFWEDNPRIFNKIRRDHEETPIGQEEIKSFFIRKVPSARDLMADIKTAGGVNEELFVQKDSETQNYKVFEGNTRLAAVKHILEESLGSISDYLPVAILPDDMGQAEINAIVGQAHLVGKKEWDSYEAKSFIYREYDYRMKQNDRDEREVIASLNKEFLVKTSEVTNAVKAFSFIEKYDLEDSPLSYRKFVYIEEYCKSKIIQDCAEVFNNKQMANAAGIQISDDHAFDKMYIAQLKRDKTAKAVDIRDYLKNISNAAKNGNYEPIKSLLEDKATIEDAVRLVDEEREDIVTFINKTYSALKKKGVNNKALQDEVDNNQEFREKISFITNTLQLYTNLDDGVDAVTGADHEVEIKWDESKTNKTKGERPVTFPQCKMLAAKISKLPYRPNSLTFPRLQAFFLNKKSNDDSFNQNEVHDILSSIEDNKVIPQYIIDGIEHFGR
jgi:hypothetical protein